MYSKLATRSKFELIDAKIVKLIIYLVKNMFNLKKLKLQK